jgi:hypothetical protein
MFGSQKCSASITAISSSATASGAPTTASGQSTASPDQTPSSTEAMPMAVQRRHVGRMGDSGKGRRVESAAATRPRTPARAGGISSMGMSRSGGATKP